MVIYKLLQSLDMYTKDSNNVIVQRGYDDPYKKYRKKGLMTELNSNVGNGETHIT